MVLSEASFGVALVFMLARWGGQSDALAAGVATVYGAGVVWSRLLSPRARRTEPLSLAVAVTMVVVFAGTFAYAALGWWWMLAAHVAVACVALSVTLRERGVSRPRVAA